MGRSASMNLLIIAARIAAGAVARIRHKGKGRFDLAEFKGLGTAEQMREYARAKLESVGRGSSRAVYALTSGKVLKVAAPFKCEGSYDAGIAQNRAEADMFTDPATRDVIARILDFDPEYRWLISESVRTIDESEFEREFGCDILSVGHVSNLMLDGAMSFGEACEQAVDDGMTVPTREAVDMFLALAAQGQGIGDMELIYHWGKSADGRIVLLDYGFTREVSDTFYSEDSEAATE